MNIYEAITRQLLQFIQSSPSVYHVVANAAAIVKTSGAIELKENAYWNLIPGQSYYVTRGDSSMIAFRLPKKAPVNFQIIASHSDSPTFKIKEHPEVIKDGHYIELNVERYGGMLCAPWFDRPLSIAGRVLVEQDGVIKSKLIDFKRDMVMLPSLAIHMNREANTNMSYKIQSDMLPLFGDPEANGAFLPLIAREAGVEPEQILGHDLFLYSRSQPSIWGACEEYFSCGKLDDLQCAYSSLYAWVNGTADTGSIRVCGIFDNEEVGSQTKQGANSTFLSDVLERIVSSLGYDRETYMMLVSNGFMISADNAHAVHPNNVAKADPSNHPYMNHGVVIKFNANQKYTTDGVSAAIFRAICNKAGIPTQTFVNHSDVAGGSTLGNISNSHVSLNTIDIGAPQLGMHSPYETSGIRDTWFLANAMKAFYDTEIKRTENGDYVV